MGIASTTNTAFLGVGQYPPPIVRGSYYTVVGEMVARQSLPDDSQGVFYLHLENLVIGSAIQVETIGGLSIMNINCDTTTEILTLPVYASGSPNNNLIVKVRKGSSAPYYRPWDTLVTATLGSQSIYVSQIPD